jgi:hypothetical protein
MPFDTTVEDIAPDRVHLKVVRAWRTLAVLSLLGLISFAAVSDQPSGDQGNRRECGPFILGQSLLGGCDWLE